MAIKVKGLLPKTELVETFGGTDALAALAPMRQIPILEHDDLILPESQIIADYLDEIIPSPPLLPPAPALRARARLLARIADLYIAPYFLTLIVGMRPPARPNDMAEAFSALRRGLAFAETYLDTDGACAVGDTISMADIALAPFVFYVPHLADWHGADAFPDHPKCAAYLDSIAKNEHMSGAFAEMETAYKARIKLLKD